MTGSGSTEGALAGIRVVDCSSGTAGPRATGLLSDHGADVIWIEPPGGDEWRHRHTIPYSVFNRGKRSVVLDVTDPAQREQLIRLLATADVFVDSWAPGTAAALGLDYSTLHARLPSLVFCSITGFGDDGDLRNLPDYEALVHAAIGSMGEQAGVRDGPIFQGVPFASLGAAYLAVIGILAALYRAYDDGLGRRVETSMLDGALAYLTMLWGDADIDLPGRDPGSNRLVAKTVLCADGEYLGVHTGANGAFGRLMKVLGLDDRVPSAESGLDMGLVLDSEQRKLLDVDLHEIFASEPRGVWLERLVAADICAIPLLPPLDVFDEPQTIHNGVIIEVDDPVLGLVHQVGPGLRMTATPAPTCSPAPRVGADTEQVLGALGIDPGEESSSSDPVVDRPLLAGLKILDFAAYFAGPYASRLLADLGADVVKLEPIRGDQQRGLEVVFRSAQAGKRSISVDMKAPEGQAIGAELVAWADIVHHNMRPGAAERLGMGYEHCRQFNPDVVYLHAPGWGSTGPAKDRQSFAPMMSGYVGAEHEVAGQFNPPMWTLGNEDPGAGLLGACGMLMALVCRQRTGKGQLVESPQLNAALTHMAHTVRRPNKEVLGAMRLDPVQLGFDALDRLYETADGWLCLVALRDAEVDGLGKVLGIDLLGDPRFATEVDREANDDKLTALLMDAFAGRGTSEVLEELRAAGVPTVQPVPHNCVRFLGDPDNHRSGRVGECAHPARGKIRELAVLVRVSGATAQSHRLAPGIGDHTEQILRELGRPDVQIAELQARGVINCG